MHFYAGWILLFGHFHLRLSEIVQTNFGGSGHERSFFNSYGTDQTTSVIPFARSNVTTKHGCTARCMHTPRCLSFEVYMRPDNTRVIECSLFNTVYQANKSLVAKLGAKYYSRYFQHEDCLSWYESGYRESRVYEVLLLGKYPMQVQCVMDDPHIGGGWLVFQNRFDGSVSFDNTWAQYKRGFGYINGEFWLGNEWLHALTKSRPNDLAVIATSFAIPTSETKKKKFHHFTVDSEENNYTVDYNKVYADVNLSTKSLFFNLKGQPFSTKDKLNHVNRATDCANRFGGGWWYLDCHIDLMNGRYPEQVYAVGSFPFAEGINWLSWKGHHTSLKESKLMIRPC